MAKLLKYIWFLLFVGSTWATTFSPISIKTQIRNSDVIVHGEVISKEFVQKDSLISTKVTLSLENWLGVEVENNELEVFFPGGVFQGEKFVVHGAPQLAQGEMVILFLNLNEDSLWVNNLGLGKFSIKRVGHKKIIVNQVFPERPQVGQMDFNKFIKLSERVKKQKFQTRFKDKYEISLEKANSIEKKNAIRSVASIENESGKSSSYSVYWLVILLGGLGVLFKVFRHKFP